MTSSTTENLKTNLDWALHFASLGWRVHPLHHIKANGQCSCGKDAKKHKAGKHPRLAKGWQKKSTTDSVEIHHWWSKWPDANIGIVAGVGSKLVVIDVDDESALQTAFDSYAGLEDYFKTYTVKSGNGYHFYFQTTESIRKKIGTSALGKGIDVIGELAYVVAPPSNHVNGNYYEYIGGEIQPLPKMLYDLITNEPKREDAFHGDIPEGRRNESLTTIAIAAKRGGLSKPKLETKLLEENAIRCKPPLETEEVLQIVKSICSDGKQSFKTVWQIYVTRLPIHEKQRIILINLSHYMDKDGRNCYPTQDQMREDLGYSEKTLRKYIKLSEAGGLIQIYHRVGTQHQGRNHGYIAILPE